MSSKKEDKKYSDSEALEELILLKPGDQPLDLDLTDRTGGDPRKTPLDISLITDLVSDQTGSDLTLRPSVNYLKEFRSLTKNVKNSDHYC